MAGEIIDSMQRWLPVPEYRFVGGPYDGQTRAVDLVKTHAGMVPPKVWRLFGPLPEPVYSATERFADEVRIEVYDYRFVQRGGINAGYYKLVERDSDTRQKDGDKGTLGSTRE